MRQEYSYCGPRKFRFTDILILQELSSHVRYASTACTHVGNGTQRVGTIPRVVLRWIDSRVMFWRRPEGPMADAVEFRDCAQEVKSASTPSWRRLMCLDLLLLGMEILFLYPEWQGSSKLCYVAAQQSWHRLVKYVV
jgi:hypothetical protein